MPDTINDAVSDFKMCAEEMKSDLEYPTLHMHSSCEGSAAESFVPPKVAAAEEINLVKIEGK